MNTFLIIKKTIQSHTLYIYEIFLENFPIILQSIMAISLGAYFNSISKEFTLGSLMTYYLGVTIINTFQRNQAIAELEDEVEKGMVANYLTKPVNFIYYKIIKQFASKLYNVIINLLVILAIMFLIFEAPIISLELLFRAFLVLPITIIYFYLILSIFMYLCLIFERINDLYRIFGISAFFFGGGLVPTSYFPNFLTYLPQQFLFGSPLEFITKGVFPNLFLGIFYFIFSIVLIIFLHKYAIKRLETNGG